MSDALTYQILPDDHDKFDYQFKIIIIGDPSVGKSSITLKAMKNEFQEFYTATVGFEFFTFHIQIESKVQRIQIWDTCGQEVYRSLIASFYQACALAVLVYSIDKRETFQNISYWINEVKNQSHPDIKLILVGNKNDLSDKREVSFEEGERLAKENEMEKFFETSAKSGEHVQELFVEIGKIMYKEQEKYAKMGKVMNYGRISIGSHLKPNKDKEEKEGKCFC